MHVDHAIDQLAKQLIRLFLCDLVVDEICQGALLAEFQEHEDSLCVELIAEWAIEIHDIFVFELPHDLDLLQFAWRQPEEIYPLDLLDRDESLGFVVVTAVDGAEGATAQAKETIVDEALCDLSVAG